jgi:hypothetical protein
LTAVLEGAAPLQRNTAFRIANQLSQIHYHHHHHHHHHATVYFIGLKFDLTAGSVVPLPLGTWGSYPKRKAFIYGALNLKQSLTAHELGYLTQDHDLTYLVSRDVRCIILTHQPSLGPPRPERLWRPPSFLSDGYGGGRGCNPGDKAAGA